MMTMKRRWNDADDDNDNDAVTMTMPRLDDYLLSKCKKSYFLSLLIWIVDCIHSFCRETIWTGDQFFDGSVFKPNLNRFSVLCTPLVYRRCTEVSLQYTDDVHKWSVRVGNSAHVNLRFLLYNNHKTFVHLQLDVNCSVHMNSTWSAVWLRVGICTLCTVYVWY